MSEEKLVPERKLELSPGMAIWMIPLDYIVERDINARLMSPDKFKQLVDNIADMKGLESLPLMHKKGEKFEIISGHHRVRAARQAKLQNLPVIVIERELTEDEVASKQLSHNSLSGYDDQKVLNEIYNSIKDLEQKLRTGLTDEELKVDLQTLPLVDIDIEFGYEVIYLLFTKPEAEKFEEMIDGLDNESKKYATDYRDFREFRETLKLVSDKYGVRNIAGIFSRILSLANERLAEIELEENDNEETTANGGKSTK